MNKIKGWNFHWNRIVCRHRRYNGPCKSYHGIFFPWKTLRKAWHVHQRTASKKTRFYIFFSIYSWVVVEIIVIIMTWKQSLFSTFSVTVFNISQEIVYVFWKGEKILTKECLYYIYNIRKSLKLIRSRNDQFIIICYIYTTWF